MNEDNAPEEPLDDESRTTPSSARRCAAPRACLILFAALGLVGWLALRWAGRDTEAGPEIVV